MLENITACISRIEEIKARFRSERVEGGVNIAPHYSAGTSPETREIKPFFPDYLVKPVKEKVLGEVEAISSYDDIIESAAAEYDMDPALIKAVIQAESGFRSGAVSSKGAMGLMQLMPATAKSLGVTNPYDPQQNINAGVKYLKQQLDRFGSIEKALAAYNAGPGSVIKYNGIPPFRETQRYIEKVLSYRDAYLSR